MEETPYNPLDKQHLGESVIDALLARRLSPLPPVSSFNGAGIYAIYYSGPYNAYRPLVIKNKKSKNPIPIYVGKAIPPGGRKGGILLDPHTSPAVYKRLTEHGESIGANPDLDVPDFTCRWLIVDDIWIPLAEAILIQKYTPLWNVVIEGFGIHDPGGGRYNQKRSAWDTLHPGRSWAVKCQDSSITRSELLSEIKKHLEKTF